jgi:hypothetical protein
MSGTLGQRALSRRSNQPPAAPPILPWREAALYWARGAMEHADGPKRPAAAARAAAPPSCAWIYLRLVRVGKR